MKIIIGILLTAMLFIVQQTTTITTQDSALYVSPFKMVPGGKAPGMKHKLLSDNNGVKEYSLVFADGDEVLSGITDFAVQQHVVAARFTAIGALKDVTIAWFDPTRKEYKLNPIHQQVELASLIGDIALSGTAPVVHTHVSVGLADGSVKGGRLVKAITYPTVELFMTVYSIPLQKVLDKETGLKLINPELK